MFGRCLSNEDRVMRGISGALPLLGKLRFGRFCFGGCFVTGTPVQMADGTTKPVEQVREGDLVLSKDETTGIIAPKRVTGTSTNTVPVVETVNLADASGKVVESLTVTGNHPFYVEGQGFLAATQLPVGIKVETKTGTLTVASTERHETAQGFVVHNFTVEGDHTYFVGSASGGTWVHNGGNVCANKIAGDLFRDGVMARLQVPGAILKAEHNILTPFGFRRLDIVEFDKTGRIIRAWETKLGSSGYLPMQRIKDHWIMNNLNIPIQVIRG